MLNIRSNPLKKVEYTVNIENKKQLEERIAKLENKLAIKDDTKNKRWFFDTFANGKRYHTEARYVRCSKEEAYAKIDKKKQEKSRN